MKKRTDKYKDLYSQGISMNQIAKKFGVSRQAVSFAINYQSTGGGKILKIIKNLNIDDSIFVSGFSRVGIYRAAKQAGFKVMLRRNIENDQIKIKRVK
jgi:hypothetical protein